MKKQENKTDSNGGYVLKIWKIEQNGKNLEEIIKCNYLIQCLILLFLREIYSLPYVDDKNIFVKKKVWCFICSGWYVTEFIINLPRGTYSIFGAISCGAWEKKSINLRLIC